MSFKFVRPLVVAFVGVSIDACSGSSTPDTALAANKLSVANTAASPMIVTATIKELMDSTVDPAADGLWEAVSTSYTFEGVDDRQPRTEDEWMAVRRHAITLIEAVNLIVMQGRHAAPAGTMPNRGELTPEEIDRRIEGTRPVFVQLAHGLRETAVSALQAIDKRDASALLDAGGRIDGACEACHMTYWYPNQRTSEH
jgi:hypothetical protein